MTAWTPTGWRARPNALPLAYDDADALASAVTRLAALPPLVTSGEIDRLRQELARAAEGDRFVLIGGDCAETLRDCRPESISGRLKVLLQMARVLGHGAGVPVVRIGRMAGQYSKPRSAATETRRVGRRSVSLPSYFGDLVNGAPFDAASRRLDPERLLTGHHHAALTLNFVRGLADGGFADLSAADAWDDPGGAVPDSLRDAFHGAVASSRAAGQADAGFWVAHEGLHLDYESALTRRVPRRDGWWCLSTHLPWIGERTRDVDGAHVAFFRGVRNPVGVKLGPLARPEEVRAIADALNPDDEGGRLVFLTRMGAAAAERVPVLRRAVAGRNALWLCDPMHGNTFSTPDGVKTRDVAAIEAEVEATARAHEALGGRLDGLHVELSGDDVTECIGVGVGLPDLPRRYETACDPRLNRAQALHVAVAAAAILKGAGRTGCRPSS